MRTCTARLLNTHPADAFRNLPDTPFRPSELAIDPAVQPKTVGEPSAWSREKHSACDQQQNVLCQKD